MLKLPKLNPLMMRAVLRRSPAEHSRPTSANIKHRCAKITLKRDATHIGTNASLPMEGMNWLRSTKPQKKLIEPKSADRSGKKEFAVMGSGASFLITKPNQKSKTVS